MRTPNIPTLFMPILVCRATLDADGARVNIKALNAGSFGLTTVEQIRGGMFFASPPSDSVIIRSAYLGNTNVGHLALAKTPHTGKWSIGQEADARFDCGDFVLDRLEDIRRQFGCSGASQAKVDTSIQDLVGIVIRQQSLVREF